MATPVVTVASGGMAVVDVTATTPKFGLPVTEAARGIAVTKVAGGGMPVTYSTVADYPAGPFTPSNLTGLIGWWDASVTASLSLTGSSVNSIADLSGNSQHLADIGFGTKTLYNATGLNGRPTINFANDSQGGLQKGSFPMGTGSTLTAFFIGVFDPSGGPISARAMSYFANGAGHDYDNAGSWLISQNTTITSVDLTRNLLAATRVFGTANTPHRCVATVNSSGVLTIYVDGVATIGATAPGNFAALGNFRLGQGDNASGNSRWHGVISEGGVATGYSDATTVASLDTYLKNHWGL